MPRPKLKDLNWKIHNSAENNIACDQISNGLYDLLGWIPFEYSREPNYATDDDESQIDLDAIFETIKAEVTRALIMGIEMKYGEGEITQEQYRKYMRIYERYFGK